MRRTVLACGLIAAGLALLPATAPRAERVVICDKTPVPPQIQIRELRLRLLIKKYTYTLQMYDPDDEASHTEDVTNIFRAEIERIAWEFGDHYVLRFIAEGDWYHLMRHLKFLAEGGPPLPFGCEVYNAP